MIGFDVGDDIVDVVEGDRMKKVKSGGVVYLQDGI
jgi:hypothetical protein